MPGFEAVKFTMNDLIRSEEEKVTIEKDSDTSIELTVPIKDGSVNFNILYSNASGSFTGLGKDSTHRLATSNSTTLTYLERDGSGNEYDEYFVATYNITQEAESYLMRAKISYDSGSLRNETTIEKNVAGSWVEVCADKIAGQACDVGSASMTISTIHYTSGGNENITLTAGTNVNFNTIVTDGGLRIYLPFIANSNSTTQLGALNLTEDGNTTAGYGPNTWYLFMDGEDKDENQAGGTLFNLTIDDNSDKLTVSQVNHAGTGGAGSLEKGDSTGIYEKYIVDAVTPKILHYTKPDEDWAEVYYPTGDSETYAEVFLAESGAVLEGGVVSVSGTLGEVLVTDAEVSSVSTKNLIIVGGSCINSAAASVLGGAYCGAAFTDATGVGSGEFLIKGVSDSTITSKLALVVAGHNAADTVNAAKYLRTQANVDTSKEYKGTTSTSAELKVA